jgi:hypothetical protein
MDPTAGTMVLVDPFEELIRALQAAGLWSDIAAEHGHALVKARIWQQVIAIHHHSRRERDSGVQGRTVAA